MTDMSPTGNEKCSFCGSPCDPYHHRHSKPKEERCTCSKRGKSWLPEENMHFSGCPCHSEKAPEKYGERDHTHCWNQKQPPCGLKGEHRCCLCEKAAPEGAALAAVIDKKPTPPSDWEGKDSIPDTEGWDELDVILSPIIDEMWYKYARKDLIGLIQSLLQKKKAEARTEVIEETIAWLDSEPQDFCNDGEYSDAQMADCLSGVIKSRHERLLKFLRNKISPKKV